MRRFSLGLMLVAATAAADSVPRSPEAIAQVVTARKDSLRACYDKAHAATPSLAGKFVYSLTIGTDGKVKRSAAKAPTKATGVLDACVTKQLAQLVFARGPETVINYPFVFAADDAVTKPAKEAATVDPTLVKMFDAAATLARAGKHAEALAGYRAVLETQRTKKLAVIPRFTATVHLHASYALIDLGKLAEAEKEIRLVELDTFAKPKQYDYHFTLGNILGAEGKLKPMFGELVEAISIAEDLDDMTDRPAQCWTQMLKFIIKAQDWPYLQEVGKKALEVAKLRGMTDLETKAAVALAEAQKHLKK